MALIEKFVPVTAVLGTTSQLPPFSVVAVTMRGIWPEVAFAGTALEVASTVWAAGTVPPSWYV